MTGEKLKNLIMLEHLRTEKLLEETEFGTVANIHTAGRLEGLNRIIFALNHAKTAVIDKVGVQS